MTTRGTSEIHSGSLAKSPAGFVSVESFDDMESVASGADMAYNPPLPYKPYVYQPPKQLVLVYYQQKGLYCVLPDTFEGLLDVLRTHFKLASDHPLRITVGFPEYGYEYNEVYSESWPHLKSRVNYVQASDVDDIQITLRCGVKYYRVWINPEKAVGEAIRQYTRICGLRPKTYKMAYFEDVPLLLTESFSRQNVPNASVIDLDVE